MNFDGSLSAILGTGLAAGVVTFALNLLRDFFRERHAKIVKAKHQAFQLSNKLKALSITCESLVSLYSIEEAPPDQQAPDPPSMPEIDFFELTDGLTDLEMNDLARIADLQLQRIADESFIHFGWRTWMDVEDVGQLQVKRLNHLSTEASSLAALVRRKHKLPEFGDQNVLTRQHVNTEPASQ